MLRFARSLAVVAALALATPTVSAAYPAAFARDTGYGHLPLHFEPTSGTASMAGDFVAHGPGYSVRLAATAAAFRFRHSSQVVRMRLEHANPESRAAGLDQLPGTVSDLRGNDPSRWRRGVPTYARVRYADIYPGIDLVYYGDQRRLEHDFIVAPGADPGVISVVFDGIDDDLELNEAGELVMRVAGAPVQFRKPTLYQEIDGTRRNVAGSYILKGPRRVGFEVGPHDPVRPLVIDPVLVYSTFLGGSGFAGYWDVALAIAVDAAGSAYVTGETVSVDFPVSPAFDDTCGTYAVCDEIGIVPDAFVAKLNPAGTALVYATYLGGRSRDSGAGIAVDGDGAAYVTGTTESEDFPTTPGAFQPFCQLPGFSCQAGFVTKLSPDGTSLVYSTYLLGGKNGFLIAPTEPRGIAVDALGHAYVTGSTLSPSFPTTAGAFQTTPGGLHDAFVIKLNPTGSAPVYSTYLGGQGIDVATAIALGVDGSAYVVGGTDNAGFHQVNDFPVTPGAFQAACAVGDSGLCLDGFVAKLDPSGSTLVYSTFLGGASELDRPLAVAVDADGHAYVTGGTKSSDFPTTGVLAGPVSRADPFGAGFVTKVNPTGSTLVYSTLIQGVFAGRAIAVDSAGSAYVAGEANPFSFVPKNVWQGSGMNYDAFLLKVDPAGQQMVYSMLLGGFGNDEAHGIALDSAGNVYMTGWATSYDFPLQRPMEIAGHRAFVAKLAEATASADLAVSMSGVYIAGTANLPAPMTYTVTAVNNGPSDARGVTVQAVAVYGEDVQAVTASQGACRRTAGASAIVVCDLGDLPHGAAATVTIGVLRTFPSTGQWTVTVNGGAAEDPDPTNNRFTGPVVLSPVTVTKAGLGTGVVRSTPAGIDCGTTCSAYFNVMTTEVILRAIPDPGESSFSVWSGDCRAGSVPTECRVDVRYAPSVVAVFASGLPPVIEFSAPVYSVIEDAGTVVALLTRSGNLTGTSTVTVTTNNTGTGRAGEHYVATRRTVTFAPGETTAAVAVGVLADALVNGTRYVDLTLSGVKGATLGRQSFSGIEIRDDDTGGTIQLDAGGVFTVAENARTAIVTVTRTGTHLAGGVTVRYSASAETATSADFTPVSGTLTFGPGVTSRTFPVTIKDNTTVNPPRTIRLVLSTPAGGAVLGTPSTGRLTLVEDDSPGTFQFAAAAFTVNETAGSAAITILRTGTRLAGGVTVRFETRGASAQPGLDYTEVARTLTFTPNQARQTVTVPVRNNQLADGERIVDLVLLDPGAGAVIGDVGTAVLRIVDDDQPVVRFTAPAVTVTEGGAVTLTLTRAKGLGSPVTAGLALTGGTARLCPDDPCDFSLEATTITFGVGQTSRTVRLSTTPNTRVNGPRTAQLALTGLSVGTTGAPATVAVTIRDDEQGGIVQFGPAALTVVAGAPAILTVTRSGANLAGDVTVDFAVSGGTALPGVDFMLDAGRLTFAPGQRSATIPVATLPRAGAPAVQTVKVTLGSPGGGAALSSNIALRTATVTIRAATP